jgi:hypothetical protein
MFKQRYHQQLRPCKHTRRTSNAMENLQPVLSLPRPWCLDLVILPHSGIDKAERGRAYYGVGQSLSL